MDLWVFAAAAGAGFLSNYWKNVIREREGLSESFGGNLIHSRGLGAEDKQFDKRLERPKSRDRDRKPLRRFRRQCHEEVSDNFDEMLPMVSHLDGNRSTDTEALGIQSGYDNFLGDPLKEMASTSCVGERMNCRKDEKRKRFSLANLLHSQFCRTASNQEHHDKFEENVEFDDKLVPGLYPELSPRNFDLYYGFCRSRNTVKLKQSRGFSVKPMTSIESCLVAQICREHAETEEHNFSWLPSPSTVRPLVITDRKTIISRASNDPVIVRVDNGELKLNEDKLVGWRKNKNLIGIPPLPEIDLIQLKRKPKQLSGKLHRGRLCSSETQTSEKHLSSQGLFGVLLFCFGVGVGVMSTMLSNRREVDRLSELVKQTENLVQDLQEELEMKDSLTVQELADYASQFQENNDRSVEINELDRYEQYYEEKPQIQMAEENSESMSKIEAELEVELERLERRFSSLSVFDPDLIGDVVHGELRICGGTEGLAESDPDASSTTTSTAQHHSSNYAVSPRELSLRLHQVIQSRLEERIEELETALHESQVQLQSLEGLYSRKRHPNSNKESSSMRGSPNRLGVQAFERHLKVEDEGDALVHPPHLNMSGDALNAYNQAYEEFSRMTETKAPNPTSAIDSSDRGSYRKLDFCGENGSLEMKQERYPVHEKAKTWERISSAGSNEVSESESDEEGKLLIKHIVEKTRQGSPVVQNAQRLLLLSMDE